MDYITKFGKNYYPPLPAFSSPSNVQRETLFGKFRWKAKGNGTDIIITDGWATKNIVPVFIPQLVGVANAPKDGKVLFHRKGVENLKGFFATVESEGYLDLVISWAGSFYPRFVRGDNKNLSNHTWGTAFDINAPQNWLWKQPAAIGQKGCLLPLVPIANFFGFFWGGHYRQRKDGMHFELANLTLPIRAFAGFKAQTTLESVKPAMPLTPAYITENESTSESDELIQNQANLTEVAEEKPNENTQDGANEQISPEVNATDGEQLPTSSNNSVPAAQGENTQETITKDKPSIFVRLFTAISVAVGSVTALGLDLMSVVNRGLASITVKEVVWLLLALGIIALGLWFYDRSANRANKLNQIKLENAADKNKNTVDFVK